MAQDLAIETHGLTKRYGKRMAVEGLDLAVPAGSSGVHTIAAEGQTSKLFSTTTFTHS